MYAIRSYYDFTTRGYWKVGNTLPDFNSLFCRIDRVGDFFNYTSLNNNLLSSIPGSLWSYSVCPIVSSMAIADSNPNHLWTALITYNTGLQVWESSNGGATWFNADPTFSLPAVPLSSIAFQDLGNSNYALYAGTDYGVYYKTNAMTQWEKYGNLPAVMVTELKVNTYTGKLRVATYGVITSYSIHYTKLYELFYPRFHLPVCLAGVVFEVECKAAKLVFAYGP